ncbi:hypothetical protein L2E82_04164 [Cichorium intybus]|uniref:Uncharacterized protein n=1 Tax=Cichorium intybus TaxID=13427 RepID=A0ACB9H6L5_CICIN|nr:hypothetical protein L2E82_04164 [Cichorium intybus]
MKTFHRSIHSPSLTHKYADFNPPLKSVKSRPPLILSIIRIGEEFHGARIPRRLQHHQDIPTTMEPRRWFDAIPAPVDSRKSELSLLQNIFSTLDKAIVKFVDPPLHLSTDPNYILSDNFAPVDELNPTLCNVDVHGIIPPCLDGVYIRNGPNP